MSSERGDCNLKHCRAVEAGYSLYKRITTGRKWRSYGKYTAFLRKHLRS